MSVWGVGVSYRFGVGPGEVVAVSGKYAFWLVWDNCGDSGFVMMLEPGLDVGLQVETPIVVELNAELMTGSSVKSFGGGCVKDLEGWAGGLDVGIKAGVDGQLGVDVTHSGLLMVTVGAGLETGAGVAGCAHATYKWFVPIKIGSCPCNQSWLGKAFNVFLPGPAGVVALGRALWNLRQPTEHSQTGQD